MEHRFTLEYWINDSWCIGRLKEIPGIFSQGETLDELEENIKDAYSLVLEDENFNINIQQKINTKDIAVII